MGYKVPDWKQSKDQNMFDVTVPNKNGKGEKVFWIVKVEYLTGAQTEMLAKAGDFEGGMYALIDELSPGLGSALRDVPNKFFNEFIDAWQADSGIELGESKASSGS